MIWGDFIKEESTYSSFTVPVGISAEHKTLDWLVTRFGVQKFLISNEKREATDDNYTGSQLTSTLESTTESGRSNNVSEITVAFGLGVKAKTNLDFDLAFSAGVNTFYSFNSLISRASLKYYY